MGRRQKRFGLRSAALLFVVGVALASVSAAGGQSQRPSAAPQWLLFTADPSGLGVDQLFRITVTGKGLKQLTKGPYPSEQPAFSPNGKRIAFARLGVGIFTMNINGTAVRRLTTNGRDNSPAWSPDGKRIVFRRPSVSAWRLYVMSASGAGERRLAEAPTAGRPTWTKRGLVVPTQGDLARIDPRTGRIQKLFGARIDAVGGVDTTAVSPDLSTITYVGPRSPVPGDKGCGEGIACAVFALYSQNLRKHKAPRLLVRDTGPATFSPDGKTLAYVTQKHRIVLRALANGKARSVPTGRITPTTTSPPAWQPAR
jgi:Tol biopolymer transport system component